MAILVIRFQIKPDQVHCILNRFELKDTILFKTCPTFPNCDQKTLTSPYRTINGLCNNIHPPGHVPWGVPNTQYQRALAPNYADGNTYLAKDLKSIRLKWKFLMVQVLIFKQVYGCQGGLQMEANSHRKD